MQTRIPDPSILLSAVESARTEPLIPNDIATASDNARAFFIFSSSYSDYAVINRSFLPSYCQKVTKKQFDKTFYLTGFRLSPFYPVVNSFCNSFLHIIAQWYSYNLMPDVIMTPLTKKAVQKHGVLHSSFSRLRHSLMQDESSSNPPARIAGSPLCIDTMYRTP